MTIKQNIKEINQTLETSQKLVSLKEEEQRKRQELKKDIRTLTFEVISSLEVSNIILYIINNKYELIELIYSKLIKLNQYNNITIGYNTIGNGMQKPIIKQIAHLKYSQESEEEFKELIELELIKQLKQYRQIATIKRIEEKRSIPEDQEQEQYKRQRLIFGMKPLNFILFGWFVFIIGIFKEMYKIGRGK